MRHVGEDRHGLLRADDRDRHDRHARVHGRLHETAPTEAAQPVALPEELAASLLTLGEHQDEPALVAQETARVRRVGGDQAHLVGEHADARIALEPVLTEHVEGTRRGMFVADRLHDHRRVRR